MCKNKRGFGLIELMVIVAIIGILAAITIPNFLRYEARCKQSEAKSNLKAVFTAAKAYFVEKDTYNGSFDDIGFKPDKNSRYNYRYGELESFSGKKVSKIAGLFVSDQQINVYSYGDFAFAVLIRNHEINFSKEKITSPSLTLATCPAMIDELIKKDFSEKIAYSGYKGGDIIKVSEEDIQQLNEFLSYLGALETPPKFNESNQEMTPNLNPDIPYGNNQNVANN